MDGQLAEEWGSPACSVRHGVTPNTRKNGELGASLLRPKQLQLHCCSSKSWLWGGLKPDSGLSGWAELYQMSLGHV